MIESFRHKGVERFFLKGVSAGMQHARAAKLALRGHWSVWVSGNWRLLFEFEGEDAVLVDHRDYH